MSFSDDVRRFTVRCDETARAIFTGCVEEVARSIIEGSPITGAPGQPVGQYGPGYHPGEVGGTLRASWQTVFESPARAIIGTNLAYAESNEDGIARPGGGPYIQRSSVGGRHSVALTIAGWDRIQAFVAARVAR